MSTNSQMPTAASAQLLDVHDLAAICGCSDRHIYRLVERGGMPSPIRLGTLVRWPKELIDDWIAGGCKSVRPTRPSTRAHIAEQRG